MFETSQPNGGAVAVFAAARRRPVASSLSTDVARLIPNDTDVTVYNERGWLALNFAIMGNETRYHSPGDDLAGLDTRSLQHMGDQALAAAVNLSNGPPQARGNRIFFDVLGRAFVAMPMAVGLALFLLLLGIFGFVGWRRGALIGATSLVLGAMISGGVVAWLATVLVAALRAGTYWRAHPEIAFVAIYATVVFGALAILRIAGSSFSTARLRAACWLAFLLIGGALAIAAPGAIIYFLIPPAIVLLGMAAARWYRPAETVGGLAALLLLYLTWGEMLAPARGIVHAGTAVGRRARRRHHDRSRAGRGARSFDPRQPPGSPAWLRSDRRGRVDGGRGRASLFARPPGAVHDRARDAVPIGPKLLVGPERRLETAGRLLSASAAGASARCPSPSASAGLRRRPLRRE